MYCGIIRITDFSVKINKNSCFEGMSMTTDKLWDAALGELELELSKANFTTWFEDTFILSHDGNNLIVGVPNAFTKRWLEEKYHTNIIKALRRISELEIQSVTYEVNTKKPASVEVGATPAPAQNLVEESTGPSVQVETVTQRPDTVTVTMDAKKEVPAVSDQLDINPKHTFENFVVGKKNELAHAACMASSERPGMVYNPLFIYGGVGLGKTHLMQAVGTAVIARDPKAKILYVTCETFTNEYISAVGEGRADEFKEKYRSVDVLMVDDVQFLAGKEGTQEAFFHTFNHLHARNKQILLTSDRPPRAIPTLEQRLVSRFEGGMIVDVSLPDLETRIAILKKKLRDKNYSLPEDLAQFIASNVQNNIRELEGALNRVIAFHELNNIDPTVESVKSLLSSVSQAHKSAGAVTARRILETVSDFFEIDEVSIKGNSRKKELVVPRQIAMYLMREEIHASYPNIGQELGGRDHTTAMHACQKINRLIDEEDDKIQNDISMLRQRLYN